MAKPLAHKLTLPSPLARVNAKLKRVWSELGINHRQRKTQCCSIDILPGNNGSSSVLAKAKIRLRTANPWNIRYNSICHRTETGNGKVLVKTTYSTNTPLCTSLCTDAPPPSPIKDRFLLQEASVLATLHQPFCIALTQGFISPWAFKTTNEDYKMRGHFMQKNTIKKHEMTGKTGGWSSPFFSFFGGRWLSIFSPMLPSWNRPKFKCPPITVNQSQFLFISNFNREIMQSVQLFICSVWILRDGYQPRFIQFAMLSTGYPTLPSVALIIRTKVARISRLQVSGCLQLSLLPLSVLLIS